MATPRELETISVRLVGDGSNYNKMLKQAEGQTVKTTTEVKTSWDKSMRGIVESVGRTEGRMVQSQSKIERSMRGAALSWMKSSKDMSKSLQATARSLQSLESKMNRTAMTSKRASAQVSKNWQDSAKSVATGAAVAGVGLTATAGLASVGILKLASNVETAGVQFGTMLGQDKGREMLSNLREFSKVTPFRFDQVSGAGRTLLAFGMDSEDVMGTMQTLGDVAAGTGKDFKELAVIYGQIRGAGRLMGQDNLQLINAGFNPLQEISKHTGRSMRDLKKDMEKGLISFKMVEESFKRVTSAGGLFNKSMENQSKTAAGKFSTALDNLAALGAKIGEELLPPLNAVLDTIIEWAQELQKFSPIIFKVIGSIIVLGGVLGPLLISLASMLAPIIFVAGAIKSGLIPTIALATAKIIAITAVIGAYIVASYKLGRAIRGLFVDQNKINGAWEAQRQEIEKNNKAIEANFNKMQKLRAEYDATIKKAEQLIAAKDPEKKMWEDIAEVQKALAIARKNNLTEDEEKLNVLLKERKKILANFKGESIFADAGFEGIKSMQDLENMVKGMQEDRRTEEEKITDEIQKRFDLMNAIQTAAFAGADPLKVTEQVAAVEKSIVDLEKQKAAIVAERLQKEKDAAEKLKKEKDAKLDPLRNFVKSLEDQFKTPAQVLQEKLENLKKALDSEVIDKDKFKDLRDKLMSETGEAAITSVGSRASQQATIISDNMSLAALNRGRQDIAGPKDQLAEAKKQTSEQKKTNDLLVEMKDEQTQARISVVS